MERFQKMMSTRLHRDTVRLACALKMWQRSGQEVGHCVVYSKKGCGLEFGRCTLNSCKGMVRGLSNVLLTSSGSVVRRLAGVLWTRGKGWLLCLGSTVGICLLQN